MALLDPHSLDVADDANTLADALVFDEPGMAGEAHWNEEAKALIAGLLLKIVADEPLSVSAIFDAPSRDAVRRSDASKPDRRPALDEADNRRCHC